MTAPDPDAPLVDKIFAAAHDSDVLRHQLHTALGLLGDLDAADRLDDLVMLTDPYRHGWWSTVGPLVAAQRETRP